MIDKIAGVLVLLKNLEQFIVYIFQDQKKNTFTETLLTIFVKLQKDVKILLDVRGKLLIFYSCQFLNSTMCTIAVMQLK